MRQHPFSRLQRAAILGILVLVAALATAPAKAKLHKDQPVAEIQKGDHGLSCSDIRAQVDQMKEAQRTGKIENPAKPRQHGFLSKVGHFGGRVINFGLIKTAVSFVPFGGLAKNVPLPGEGSKDAIRESARARHERLIALYDHKSCD